MRNFFYEWLFHVFFWTVVVVLFTVIYLSNVTLILEYLQAVDSLNADPLLSYMVSDYQYLEAVMFGILFGSATFGVNIAVDYTTIHNFSYSKTILIKSLLYVLSMVLVFVLMAGIILNSGINALEFEDYYGFMKRQSFPWYMYLGGISFFVLSSMLINFISLMSRKFGPGQLWFIFLGRYKKPRTENRIFMFLDLQDSTSIAESLGHIIYSKLLQQCFRDMTKLIMRSGAEIYQYVGDEAVLTWRIRNYDDEFIKPIQLFFAYKKKLESKATYYKNKFGLVPQFKAGVNAGVVTVAEIGDLKREIAYHGDVVNTASRLRSACNEFKKQLLASEYVINNLDSSYELKIEEIGEVNLRGKRLPIKVFSIS
jgi:adenylate cyclase